MMRRKLVKQGRNALTVTLPAKWIQQKGLDAGDDVELQEKSGNIVVLPGVAKAVEKKIELDISGLDRTSFRKVLTSLYESGYDEVVFRFTEAEMDDYRLGRKVSVSDQIVNYVQALVGYAIVDQGEGYYRIKDISVQSEKEFDNVLRRVWHLMASFNKAILEGLDAGSYLDPHKGEEMFNNIDIFISFCLRLLNKKIAPAAEKYNQYHIINILDEAADHNKALCWNLHKAKKVSKECVALIKRMIDLFRMFDEFYHVPKMDKLAELSKTWYALEHDVVEAKLSAVETRILERQFSVPDTLFYTAKNVISLRNIEKDKK